MPKTKKRTETRLITLILHYGMRKEPHRHQSMDEIPSPNVSVRTVRALARGSCHVNLEPHATSNGEANVRLDGSAEERYLFIVEFEYPLSAWALRGWENEMTKRISIINFKGGVGKTTLAFQLATGIERFFDERVLLVDVDHQSSLSLTCLKADVWEKAVEDGRTVNAIFEHFTNQKKLPGKEIICKEPYSSYPKYPKLDIVPSTLQLDETELDLTSTIIGDPIESEWNKHTLICKWIEENGIDDDYDYIIFDCPPATKMVTQNAIASSHGYIIPVIPDAVSTRGLPHLTERMFKKIDKKHQALAEFLKAKGKAIVTTFEPNTKLVGIVIFRIRTSGVSYTGFTVDHARWLRKIEELYPNYVIRPYIEEGVGVPESLGLGWPVYDNRSFNVVSRGFDKCFETITKELKPRIDTL